MSKKLQGKVAIVTGASKGIGASIAEKMAEEGAAVVVNYSTSKEGADRVVQAIKQKGGNAIAAQANMANPKDIQRLFEETRAAFGKLDILINNAGIYEFSPIEEVTPEQFHKLFDINVLGVLLACRTAVNNFGASGGSIVNVSSLASISHIPNFAVYCATKAALDAVTRTLASELGPRNIRVNSINPGMVQTEGTEAMGIMESEWRKQVEVQTPLKRIGMPQDIAPAVVFLASEDASWITGETLFITGGFR
jgi:3-oxoacyl-[acyl-carrier protein] reductase